MLYGITNDGQRIPPCKDARALCPHCRGPLIPKCGQIKIHHWAHKESKGCPYSSYSMTHWHYEWLVNFDNLAENGWKVEYFFNTIRFDAFNPEKMQAVEFQRLVDLDYIKTKNSICRNEGIKLFWLISPHLFKNFVYTKNLMGKKGHILFALRAGKRRIGIVLDNFLGDDNIIFSIDFKKEAYLPKYVTDSVHTDGGFLYEEVSVSRRKYHQMPTGIYVVQEIPHFYRHYWQKRTTLFLNHKKSHFS